jgi:hypothetical protein
MYSKFLVLDRSTAVRLDKRVPTDMGSKCELLLPPHPGAGNVLSRWQHRSCVTITVVLCDMSRRTLQTLFMDRRCSHLGPVTAEIDVSGHSLATGKHILHRPRPLRCWCVGGRVQWPLRRPVLFVFLDNLEQNLISVSNAFRKHFCVRISNCMTYGENSLTTLIRYIA